MNESPPLPPTAVPMPTCNLSSGPDDPIALQPFFGQFLSPPYCPPCRNSKNSVYKEGSVYSCFLWSIRVWLAEEHKCHLLTALWSTSSHFLVSQILLRVPQQLSPLHICWHQEAYSLALHIRPEPDLYHITWKIICILSQVQCLLSGDNN